MLPNPPLMMLSRAEYDVAADGVDQRDDRLSLDSGACALVWSTRT